MTWDISFKLSEPQLFFFLALKMTEGTFSQNTILNFLANRQSSAQFFFSCRLETESQTTFTVLPSLLAVACGYISHVS